jgi:hypothetical protein
METNENNIMLSILIAVVSTKVIGGWIVHAFGDEKEDTPKIKFICSKGWKL